VPLSVHPPPPPLAKDHLQRHDDGSVVVGLKREWSSGTWALVLSPTELVECLVALVPPTRVNQQIYRGVLAGCAAWRGVVVPWPLRAPTGRRRGARSGSRGTGACCSWARCRTGATALRACSA
jgi:hypothetical protein